MGAATTGDRKPSGPSEALDLRTWLRPRTGALHRRRRLPHICEIGSRLVQSASVALVLGILVPVHCAAGAEPVKVRMGTLAPKGSSYTKHLQAMGEQWRAAPGGGVQLTI